jgi:hypothetical protein
LRNELSRDFKTWNRMCRTVLTMQPSA